MASSNSATTSPASGSRTDGNAFARATSNTQNGGPVGEPHQNTDTSAASASNNGTIVSSGSNGASVAGTAISLFYGSEGNQASRTPIRPDDTYRPGAHGAAAANSNIDSPFAPFVTDDGRLVTRSSTAEAARQRIDTLFPSLRSIHSIEDRDVQPSQSDHAANGTTK